MVKKKPIDAESARASDATGQRRVNTRVGRSFQRRLSNAYARLKLPSYVLLNSALRRQAMKLSAYPTALNYQTSGRLFILAFSVYNLNIHAFTYTLKHIVHILYTRVY